MSGKNRSKLFTEIWPAIQANMTDRQERVDFTAKLLTLFIEDDMDPSDVAGVHPDVKAAMKKAGLDPTGGE